MPILQLMKLSHTAVEQHGQGHCLKVVELGSQTLTCLKSEGSSDILPF